MQIRKPLLVGVLCSLFVLSLFIAIPALGGSQVIRIRPAYALSGCGTAPAGVLGCVAVNLTNTQSGTTAANFQQELIVNFSKYSSFLAANLQNVVIYNSSGTKLNSWVEGNASKTSQKSIVWVNLATNTIAGSSGKITIYIGFDSTGTNNYGPSSFWGEAPQLSGTWGVNDNGGKVFALYDNFSGNSLNARWTKSALTTVTVNNGITLKGTGSGADWYGIYDTGFTLPVNDYAETLFTPLNNPAPTNYSMVGATTCSSCAAGGFTAGSNFIFFDFRYHDTPHQWGVDCTTGVAGCGGSGSSDSALGYNSAQNKWYLLGGINANTANTYSNYTKQATATITAVGTYDLGISNFGNCGGCSDGGDQSTFDWVRVRIAPPSNVQPTVTFGAAPIGGVILNNPTNLAVSGTLSGGSNFTNSNNATFTLKSGSTVTAQTLQGSPANFQFNVTSTNSTVLGFPVGFDWYSNVSLSGVYNLTGSNPVITIQLSAPGGSLIQLYQPPGYTLRNLFELPARGIQYIQDQNYTSAQPGSGLGLVYTASHVAVANWQAQFTQTNPSGQGNGCCSSGTPGQTTTAQSQGSTQTTTNVNVRYYTSSTVSTFTSVNALGQTTTGVTTIYNVYPNPNYNPGLNQTGVLNNFIGTNSTTIYNVAVPSSPVGLGIFLILIIVIFALIVGVLRRRGRTSTSVNLERLNV